MTDKKNKPYDCRGCGKPLLPENYRFADGCPCNSPRGVNHGIVAKETCVCETCDTEQTGSTRYPPLNAGGTPEQVAVAAASIRDSEDERVLEALQYAAQSSPAAAADAPVPCCEWDSDLDGNCPKHPPAPFEMKRSNFLGAPVFYELNHACRAIYDAFGGNPYLVGSCLHKRDFRDVDIRLILEDHEYKKLFPDGGGWTDARWTLLCMSISEWLKAKTGLKIDFQIQQQTEANKDYPRQPRHALGIVLNRTANSK